MTKFDKVTFISWYLILSLWFIIAVYGKQWLQVANAVSGAIFAFSLQVRIKGLAEENNYMYKLFSTK